MAKGSLVATGGQGILSLVSDPPSGPVPDPDQTHARDSRRTYKYSEHFEKAWAAYGRGDEKQQAYVEWKKAATSTGGEVALCQLVIQALEWQTPPWAAEGWKFAPYFRRYLKNRRWEDERKLSALPAVPAGPRSGAGWSPAARGKNYREGLTTPAVAPGTGRG